MKFEIDMTMKFTQAGNHISRATDYGTKHLIIEDGIEEETLVNLVMNHVFPEFHVFEGWDEEVIAHGRIILLEEEKRSKDGFVLLYCDGSIAYAVEHGGEIVLRYIGNQPMMHNRMDDLHCVKPKVNNWFTAHI